MQRKNYILRASNSKKLRKGFAMIMAIGFLIIMSSILALTLSLTTKTTKNTTDLYLYEQAVLLSKSAAEYALLRIAQANPCTIDNLNFTQDSIYDINIDIRYIYSNPSPCTNLGEPTRDYFQISTPELNGSVLMDITVTVDDANVTSEKINYFRRSIQKL